MKYTRQQISIRIYINYLEYRINTPNGKNYYDNEGIWFELCSEENAYVSVNQHAGRVDMGSR